MTPHVADVEALTHEEIDALADHWEHQVLALRQLAARKRQGASASEPLKQDELLDRLARTLFAMTGFEFAEKFRAGKLPKGNDDLVWILGTLVPAEPR